MSRNQVDPVDLERLFIRYLRNEYSVADFNALQRHFDTQASQEQLQKLVLSALEEQARIPTDQQDEHEDAHENVRIGRVVARLDTRIAGNFAHPTIKKLSRFGLG